MLPQVLYAPFLYHLNKPGDGVFAGGFASRKHPIFPYLLRRYPFLTLQVKEVK